MVHQNKEAVKETGKAAAISQRASGQGRPSMVLLISEVPERTLRRQLQLCHPVFELGI